MIRLSGRLRSVGVAFVIGSIGLLWILVAARIAEQMIGDGERRLVPTATVAAATIPAATPTFTPMPPPVAYYRVTYYGPGFEGGLVACGTDIYGPFDSTDPTTAAAGEGGPTCGTRLDLCSVTSCQVVVIKDACGGCSANHLDLSRAAWDALGQPVEVYVRREWAALAVPEGLTVRYDGCSPTYGCSIGTNYYDAGGNVIVFQPHDGWSVEPFWTHERCHAHQAAVVGRTLQPSEYDLHPWYVTSEGASYMAVVGVPEPWPFSHSAINGIESFAWTCSYYMVQPEKLASVCPVCYSWAREELP